MDRKPPSPPQGVSQISRLIGNTPMVRLKRAVDPDSAAIFAKLEWFNPGGSIKDRICLEMLDQAERKRRIKKGGVVIEPTSGNTGIGLAMLSAIRGYRCIIVMPDNMSQERSAVLRAYGAELILTPAQQGMQAAVKKAEKLLGVLPAGSFMPRQFENPDNPQAHRRTTAAEILRDTAGKVDVLVCGVGTGGTITGVGELLKKYNPEIKVVAVEPAASPVLSGGRPGAHKIQGIGAGFIPGVLNRKIIDRVVTVEDDQAFSAARKLSEQEGLFVGISSGAAFWAASKLSREIGRGKNVVVIFPDSGNRYISLKIA